MDCSLPGSSVHGIFQARVLEWVTISFSTGSSQPRDRTLVSSIQTDALPYEPPGLQMRKCLNGSDNHDNVVTDQEQDILERELNPEEDCPGQTLLI